MNEKDENQLFNDINIYKHFDIKGWKFSDDDTSDKKFRDLTIVF